MSTMVTDHGRHSMSLCLTFIVTAEFLTSLITACCVVVVLVQVSTAHIGIEKPTG